MSRPTAIRTARGRPSDPAAVGGIVEPGLRALAGLYSYLAEWYRRSRSRAELARFPPRMLRDIGITPDDRERECGKPFWRP